jgi:hypothetical protein
MADVHHESVVALTIGAINATAQAVPGVANPLSDPVPRPECGLRRVRPLRSAAATSRLSVPRAWTYNAW